MDDLLTALWALAQVQASGINTTAGSILLTPGETLAGRAAQEISRLRLELDRKGE